MKRINLLAASAALAAFSLAPVSAAPKAVTLESEARATLEQIHGQYVTVADEAFTLEQFARKPERNTEIQREGLDIIKDNVNKIASELKSLEVERNLLSAEDVKALDQIRPLAAEIADNTEHAILNFNANSAIWHGPYVDETAKVSQDASEAADAARNTLKLEQMQSKEAQLEKHVEEAPAN